MNQEAITQTQPAVAAAASDTDGPPLGFFAIGVVINLVLIMAYVVWAIRQGKKSDRHEKD